MPPPTHVLIVQPYGNIGGPHQVMARLVRQLQGERYHVPLMPFFIILASLGFKHFKRWNGFYFIVHPLLGLAAVLTYFAVKAFLQ